MNELQTEKLRERMMTFESADAPDPEGLWAAIESKLPAPPGSASPAIAWWRRPLTLRIAASVAIVTLISLAAFWLFNQQDVLNVPQLADSIESEPEYENQTVPESETAKAEFTDSGILTETEKGTGTGTKQEPLLNSKTLSSVQTNPATQVNTNITESVQVAQLGSVSETDCEKTESSETPISVTETTRNSVPEELSQPADPWANSQPADIRKRKPRSKQRISIQLLASNSLSTDASVNGWGSLTPDSNPYAAARNLNGGSMSYINNGVNYYENALNYNGVPYSANSITDVKHSKPLHFGLMVNYPLTTRWGFGIGLDYTLLKSELTAGNGSSFYQNEQTLHYLGIPVRLNYRWLHFRHFEMYGSMGPEIEFGIKGKMEIDNYVNSYHVSHEVSNIGNIPVAVSVQGHLGAEYMFLRHYGLYVEPGISYHFDDRSSLITLYNQKPLNFHLSFGLRLTLGSE
jgi:hypothetical protein